MSQCDEIAIRCRIGHVLLGAKAMTEGTTGVSVGVVLSTHLVVPRCVSRDDMDPNNNLDSLSHDFCVEISLVSQLTNLVGYCSNASVLVLEFCSTVGLISLSFSVG
jgi:hypothetical protein